MSDHETTLTQLATCFKEGTPTHAACLAGADALRRGTCGTCKHCVTGYAIEGTGSCAGPNGSIGGWVPLHASCKFHAPTRPRAHGAHGAHGAHAMTRDEMIEKLTAAFDLGWDAHRVYLLAPRPDCSTKSERRTTALASVLAALRSRPAPPEPRINTRCPSCGSSTLFVGEGGHLTCSLIGCKQPVVERAIEELRSRPAPPDDLERKHRVPDDVMMLARAGKLIDAIKLLRHDFELPLKEAKLLVEDAMRIEAIRATAAALAAPAPVAAPAHVSVSQGAALAAALDALESDATTDQRREAWDRLRDEFYPVAALAPETPAPTEPTR